MGDTYLRYMSPIIISPNAPSLIARPDRRGVVSLTGPEEWPILAGKGAEP